MSALGGFACCASKRFSGKASEKRARLTMGEGWKKEMMVLWTYVQRQPPCGGERKRERAENKRAPRDTKASKVGPSLFEADHQHTKSARELLYGVRLRTTWLAP